MVRAMTEPEKYYFALGMVGGGVALGVLWVLFGLI